MKENKKRSLISQATFDAKRGIEVPASAIVKSEGFKSSVSSMKEYFKNKKKQTQKATA